MRRAPGRGRGHRRLQAVRAGRAAAARPRSARTGRPAGRTRSPGRGCARRPGDVQHRLGALGRGVAQEVRDARPGRAGSTSAAAPGAAPRASASTSGGSPAGRGGLWVTKARSPSKFSTTVMPGRRPADPQRRARSTPRRAQNSCTTRRAEVVAEHRAQPGRHAGRGRRARAGHGTAAGHGELVSEDLLARPWQPAHVTEDQLKEDRAERDHVQPSSPPEPRAIEQHNAIPGRAPPRDVAPWPGQAVRLHIARGAPARTLMSGYISATSLVTF